MFLNGFGFKGSPEPGIVFVSRQDQATLKSFATLCHERVQDRDVSFTLEKRVQLYDRWLASNQPCLMAVTQGCRQLVAASIVLPLTAEGYERFCFHGLDALDIGSHHIVHPNSKEPCRYLLIDMLATDKDVIRTFPKLDQERLRGIGFRAVLYHVASFFDADRQRPVIMCSTVNKPLVRLLKELNFDDKCKQAGNTPIYRVDLGRIDFYPRSVGRALSLIIALARHYRRPKTHEDDERKG